MHCIVHREALDVGYELCLFWKRINPYVVRSWASEMSIIFFPEFQMLDHFANKVYDWVYRSANGLNELKDVFEED